MTGGRKKVKSSRNLEKNNEIEGFNKNLPKDLRGLFIWGGVLLSWITTLPSLILIFLTLAINAELVRGWTKKREFNKLAFYLEILIFAWNSYIFFVNLTIFVNVIVTNPELINTPFIIIPSIVK
ncbi:MAG: hypothetical protein ACTSPI_15665 [Candidatus Heimdallarchaeaceae archaeon]